MGMNVHTLNFKPQTIIKIEKHSLFTLCMHEANTTVASKATYISYEWMGLMIIQINYMYHQKVQLDFTQFL